MMHKRTLHSLLIVSFIVAFAASMSFATNDVNIQTKTGLLRCTNQALNVTVNLDQDVSAVECVFVVTNGGAFVNTLGITWQLPAGVLSDRVVDLTRANGTAPDTIRFAASNVSPGLRERIGNSASGRNPKVSCESSAIG